MVNIVWIAIDALRADRLGCYGYPKATSPFIDQLAREGVLFERHFTPVVPTQPAFTTLFSGSHPLTHHIVAHEGRLQPNPLITWLPLLLRHHRYTTVSVDNLFDHKPWFARGFEYYINPRRRGEYPDCHVFNERAVEWLTKCRREPFFLNLHYWDTHSPYVGPVDYVQEFYDGDPTLRNRGSLDAFYRNPQVERWPNTWFSDLLNNWPHAVGNRIEDLEFIHAHYDAEVRVADDGVREIYETLDREGLLDDTLIVVYSDHGEELGDHGIYFDHHGLYDSNLRTPLIMHWPKGLPRGKRVSVPTQHQDLFATMMEAIEQPVPEQVEGHSLIGPARSDAHWPWNHAILSCECTWQAKWAMRTAEYKLIVSREQDYHGNPMIELYDLLDDPNEHRNVASTETSLVRRLSQQFEDQLAEMLTGRKLKGDPILHHGLTLGKRMFDRLGLPYPPKRMPRVTV